MPPRSVDSWRSSFTAFPLAAQLAFLVTGPLIDLKLGVLYSATFRRRFLPTLVAIVVLLSGVALAIAFVALSDDNSATTTAATAVATAAAPAVPATTTPPAATPAAPVATTPATTTPAAAPTTAATTPTTAAKPTKPKK